MLAELFNHEACPMSADFVPYRMGGEEFAAGHEQACPGFLQQPVGQAEVVGVEVRDDDAFEWSLQSGEDAAPDGAAFLIWKPCVDQGPAVAVAQQPEVDVVQLERQGQTEPENARANLKKLARGRGFAEWVMQGHEKTGRVCGVPMRTSYHTGAD